MITKIGHMLVLAADKKKNNENLKNKAMLAAAVPGAALIGSSIMNPEELTGRTNLYHGTPSENIQSILDNGLKATTDKYAPNTKLLKKIDPERYAKSLGKVYLDKNLDNSAQYAFLADIRKNGGIERMPTREELVAARKNVVNAKVPLYMFKTVINPEVDMPYEEWLEKTKKSALDQVPKSQRAFMEMRLNSVEPQLRVRTTRCVML